MHARDPQNIPTRMKGAALPAVVLIAAASTLLALGALQSAKTATSLGATVQGARNAFMLAELGIESGMEQVLNNPALLHAATPLELLQFSVTGKGHVRAVLHQVATDNHCPGMATATALRTHYEIHATGTADMAALTTHTLGFHVCTELCTSLYCIAAESLPVRSYWSAAPGSQATPPG